MRKWDYIRLISRNGSQYGRDGGVLDLLQWCGKPNTAAVTEEEAKAFWEERNPGEALGAEKVDAQ